MCNPMILTVATTVVSAAGQWFQASAQAQAMEYQAQINEQNAVLADRRAKDAIERGQLEEERKKREGTMVNKQQEASFAAANIDTGYGSPVDVITSSSIAAELDAAIIRSNAEREAEDYQIQGVNYRNQAQINRFDAKAARTGGIFAAGGTILNGGASIFRYS